MALKEFKLDLSKASVAADNVFSDASTVTITTTGGKEEASATVVGNKQNSVKLNGFGILNATATEKVATFVADAALKTGAYTASFDTAGNNATSLKSFDASRASASLSLTTSLVSVHGGELKGGSGNDTILVDNNAANDLKIFGGKGADTFEVKSTSAQVTVADYNYAEGDKISIASTSLPAFDTFATNGQVTVKGAATTVVGSEADGVYKFGFIDDHKKKYDYVAAATGADVNYTAGTDTLYFKADGSSGSVVVDASKAAAASITATVKDAKITLGGNKDSKNSVVAGINATDSSVFVDLGYGKDTVSVASDAALTLIVGREDGTDNKLVNVLDGNDTLVLTTGKISDVGMDSATGALEFGATSITNAFGTSTVGAFDVQFGSDEAKKLAYSTFANAIAYSKGVSYYLGKGDGSISIASGSTDDVLLNMVDYTNGITSVGLKGVNANNAKAAVNITAKADTSIDAGYDHANAEWKFDLTANKDNKAGYLDLGDGTKKGVDRIVLSDVKDNKDSVKGFNAGEDILVLSDVDKLTEKTFTVTNANKDVVLQNSKASIAGAFAAGTNLNVVLSDDTAKKVALADADATVVATQETTTVINQTDKDGIVKFDIDEATESDAFVVDMTGTVSNAIDYLGKFTSIDATVGAANALIVGNEAITNIKVTGSADHGAAVWAGAKANAEIDLSATLNHAGNIIWTGALDGASSVKGFEDKDKLYVYGVDGLSKTAVAESFGIDAINNAVYHTGASSMTFLGGTSKISVMYMDSTAEGGYGYQNVAISGAGLNFATDVDVYIGTTTGNQLTVANDKVEEGQLVAINLSNKGAGSVEEGGAYYKGVHNIDASASAGTFLLIGDNTNGANLIGGVKGNAIWGGGDASQNMEGGAGVADIFWFGSKDGHDVVTNFGTKDGDNGDAVFLYDATSIDAVQITAEGNNAAKVVFKNTTSTLTLNNVSNIDDVKFMLNNADGGYDYYKYDSKTSAFVQQKA